MPDFIPVDYDPFGPEFGNPLPGLQQTYAAGQNYQSGMNAAGDAVIGAATAGPMAVGRLVTGQGGFQDVPDAAMALLPGIKGAAIAAPLMGPLMGIAAKAAEREAVPAAESFAGTGLADALRGLIAEADAKVGPASVAQKSAFIEPPPPASGLVRFFHGGTQYEGGPRWLTTNQDYARQGYTTPAAMGADPRARFLQYVDVPEDSPLLAGQRVLSGKGHRYSNFEAPEELAQGLRPYFSAAESVPKGITAYHGTTRDAASALRSGSVNIPPSGEQAFFLSDTPMDAYEFGRMKGGYDPRNTKVVPHWVDTSGFHEIDAGGDVYDPEMMGQMLRQARQSGAPGAIISNIQNFEHGLPSTTYAVFDQSRLKAIGKSATRESAPPSGIIAYHGSPHDFDAFDLSKIGTGEGAQAYGHGLYFAENPETAQYYREALLKPDVPTDLSRDAQKELRGIFSDYGSTISKPELQRLISDKIDPWEPQPHLNELLGAIEQGKIGGKGKMYQVSIATDPEHFLDWDKPLKEQPQAVIKTLARAAAEGSGKSPAEIEQSMRSSETTAGDWFDAAGGKRGSLGFVWSNAEEASQALREAGIPGIKYLDQGSRTSGTGSRNYVVFDDKTVSILKKYGMAGLIAGGAAHFALTPVEHDPFATGQETIQQ